MREIKYRQKLKNGEWHYWGYIFEDENSFTSPVSSNIAIGESEQYTGLKDKNGVEIYEGDILQDGKGENGEVKYCNNVSAFLMYCEGVSFWLNEGNAKRPDQLQYTEVIGTIHEVTK